MAKKKAQINADLNKIKQDLTQRKAQHKQELEKGINFSWGKYLTQKNKLTAQREALKVAVTEEDQTAKRREVKICLNLMRTKLQGTKDFVGDLSDDFAIKIALAINQADTIKFDVFYPTELTYIKNVEYRSGNSNAETLIAVTSEAEASEDLITLKRLYTVVLPEQKTSYEKAFKDYEDAEGRDALRNWSGSLEDRTSVEGEAKKVRKTCEKLYWMANAMQTYWKDKGLNPSPENQKLIDDAMAAREDYIDQMMIDLGNSMATPKLYRPKVVDAKDLKEEVKNNSVVLEENTWFFAQYENIKKLNASFLKKLDEIEAASENDGPISKLIEDARNLLFRMRNEIRAWLDRHKEDTGEKQVKQTGELKRLDQRLQDNILLVAHLGLTQDNFTDVQTAFHSIEKNMLEWRRLKIVVTQLNKDYEEAKSKGLGDEVLNIISDKDAAQLQVTTYLIDVIKGAIIDYLQKAEIWRKKHAGMKGFSTKKKENTLSDNAKKIKRWVANCDDDDLISKANKGLKQDEPYAKKDDKLYKKLLNRRDTVKNEFGSDNYKKRFRHIHDMLETIQQWEFKYRNSHGSAFDKIQEEVLEIKETFAEQQYNAITAHMSIDGLEKGMNDSLKGYVKLVKSYNDKKMKKDLMPQLLQGSIALKEFLDVWQSQYDQVLKTKVEIPKARKAKLEALKTEHAKFRLILEDNNLVILSGGMVDPDLDEKLLASKKGVGNLKKEMTTLEEKVTNLANNQTTLEANVTQLNMEVTKLDALISRAKDPTEKNNLRNDLAAKQQELLLAEIAKNARTKDYEDKKKELSDLIKAFSAKKTELKKEKDPSKRALLEQAIEDLKSSIGDVKTELKELMPLETLQKGLLSLTNEFDAEEEKIKHLQKQKEARGPAAATYARIMNLYEYKSDFEFEKDLNESDQLNRIEILNKMFELLERWEKEVRDPNLERLKVYKAQIDKVRADLEFHNKQFDAGRPYLDETYQLIKQTYTTLIAIKDKTSAAYISKATFDRYTYCRKLVDYWNKENPVKTDTNEAKYKEVITQIGPYLSSQIKNERFAILLLQKKAEEALEKLTNFVDETHKDLDVRLREFSADKIYYGDDKAAKKKIKDGLGSCEIKFKALFEEMKAFFILQTNAIASNDLTKIKTANKKISAKDNSFTAVCKELQFELNQIMVNEEKLVFSVVGEEDFDLYAGNFSEDQLRAMIRSLANVTERARAVLKTGGTANEAEQMFEHIPVALWPDEFVSELQAFKKVESAFMEEKRQEAQNAIDEEQKALGISDFLLDIGSSEGAKEIADVISGLNELTTFGSWDATEGDYVDNYLTGGQQTDAHGNFANALDWTSFGLELFSSIKEFKNLPPKEQAKAAHEYLFTGQVNFEDGGELTDPAKSNLSERKRIIILTGLRFVATTSAIIESTADNLDGPGELLASCKGITEFFNGLASIIELGDENKVAKSTQEYWNNNLIHATNIAKGLLGVGVTIAETVKLFQQIPSGVVPALGIATSAIDLGLDIYGIAQKVVLRHKTKSLQAIAEEEDRGYVGPLQQEINSLNRRIAKQSVDAVANVVAIAGGITTAAGAPEAGAAIAVVAGVLKLGNKVVFFGLNEKLMADCRGVLKKARAGDREAMIDIMSQSPLYAKMFIAVGATNDPPDKIALEFLRQRGITEQDLKDEGTCKWIVRKYIRTQLLDVAEEKDSHDSHFKSYATWVLQFKEWVDASRTKKKFWTKGEEDYYKMMQLYSLPKLQKLINEYLDKKSSWIESRRVEAFKNATLIQETFQHHNNYLENHLEDVEILLDEAITKDKQEVSNKYELEVKQLEREKEGIEPQIAHIGQILMLVAKVFE